MTVSSNITKWLSNITSVTMFTLAFSYFISTTLSETYIETFLSHEAQLFVNCLGSSVSLSGWIMSIIISVGDTDCGNQDNADVKKYFKRLKEVEQRVRDSSLMLLFILTGLSFGMDTSNILGVFTLVAIGVGRLFSKYFDVHRMLAEESEFKESTKMENALAMTLFALAFINEVVLHDITWNVYLIAVAVLLELGFLLYKGCSDDDNSTRMMFEETTASLFHFVLIGVALKETSSNAHIMTLAALAVGDSF